jgi:hypothetical protein
MRRIFASIFTLLEAFVSNAKIIKPLREFDYTILLQNWQDSDPMYEAAEKKPCSTCSRKLVFRAQESTGRVKCRILRT